MIFCIKAISVIHINLTYCMSLHLCVWSFNNMVIYWLLASEKVWLLSEGGYYTRAAIKPL